MKHLLPIPLFLAACLPLGAAATNKPTCAVLTFDAKAGIAKDEAGLLSDRFEGEFNKLGQYTLVSRVGGVETDHDRLGRAGHGSGTAGFGVG